MHLQRLWRRARVLISLGPGRGAWTTFLAFASGQARFWSIWQQLLHRAFQAQHLGFRVRYASRSFRLPLPLLGHFFLVALGGSVLAAVTSVLTLSVDRALHTAHASLLSLGIRLPGLQQSFINTAEAAILQLSVVIIGLYAAAFSVVVSTVYGRIYGDIRELLFKDLTSNAFLRTMAFLSCYSAFLLLAQSLGFSIGYFSVVILTFALAYGVQTFVTVGIGVFRLFDPLQLLPQLRLDLSDAIRGATHRGYRSDALAFQNAYRQRAERNLVALEHMLEASNRSPEVARIATFVLTIFRFYQTLKRQIPSSSAWFKTRYQHVDWLTATAEQLTLALNTRTRIQPREIHLAYRWLRMQRFIYSLRDSIVEVMNQMLGVAGASKAFRAHVEIGNLPTRADIDVAIDQLLSGAAWTGGDQYVYPLELKSASYNAAASSRPAASWTKRCGSRVRTSR